VGGKYRCEMNILLLNDQIKEDYLKQLKNFGEEKFYQRCVGKALMNSAITNNPDVRLLLLADEFFKLFRRTGKEEFALISKVLRRSAHTVNRQLNKINGKNDSREGKPFLRAV
jgi:hypothetical protein